MAKPKRSRAKFQKARNVQQNTLVSRPAAVTTSDRPIRTAAGAQSLSAEDRYRYIASDMRSIAIISGVLIVILFALTFFIQ